MATDALSRSIVKVTGPVTDQEPFGTGFLCALGDGLAYIVTCQHVVDAIRTEPQDGESVQHPVLVDGHPAEVIAHSCKYLDLAVLRVPALTGRNPLPLKGGAATEAAAGSSTPGTAVRRSATAGSLATGTASRASAWPETSSARSTDRAQAPGGRRRCSQTPGLLATPLSRCRVSPGALRPVAAQSGETTPSIIAPTCRCRSDSDTDTDTDTDTYTATMPVPGLRRTCGI